MVYDRKNNKFLYTPNGQTFYYIVFPQEKNLIEQIAIDYDDEINVVDHNQLNTDVDDYNDISSEAISDYINQNWNIINYSNDYYVYQLGDDELTDLTTDNIEEGAYGMDNYPVSTNADLTHQNIDHDWNVGKYSVHEDDGDSLTLYHGSRQPLEFDDLYTGRFPDDLKRKLDGLYTTKDIDVTKDYGDHIYELSIDSTANILDLSDGFDLLEFMLKNEIITKQDLEDDPDLEGYIVGGRLFQRDLEDNYHRMDEVVSYAREQNYDIVVVPDDLGSLEDNNAYIILNKNIVNNFKEVTMSEERNSNDSKKQTLKEFKENSQINFNEGDYDAYHSEETESDWDKAEKELRQQKGEEPDPEEVVDYLRSH